MPRHRLTYADWSGAEYCAAARAILSGRVVDGPSPAMLGDRMGTLYAPSLVYPVNYGHTALRIALDMFRARQPARSEVLVPAYICPSVVETVEAAGLCAVPVDVGPDLNLSVPALAAAIGPATLAVVAPHMFGCPAPIAEIETLCRDAGIFLVDDAAQVVGERAGDRLLGTFGDVGLISFAQSKALVTGVRGSGGLLLVNRPEFEADAGRAWAALPAPRGRLAAFIYFLWYYEWIPFTGSSAYYLFRIRNKLGLPPPEPGQSARIANLDASIALVQLDRLARLREQKILAANMYHVGLSTFPAFGFPQYAPGRYLSRIMLSLPPGADLDVFRRAAAARGVATRLGYTLPVDQSAPHAGAAALSARLFGVPFRAGMEKQEIEEICSILNEALAPAMAAPTIGTVK